MNKDILQGNWTQLKAKGLQMWGKLTHDEQDIQTGKREELIGRLQQRYGWAREEAETRMNAPTSSDKSRQQ